LAFIICITLSTFGATVATAPMPTSIGVISTRALWKRPLFQFPSV
jgi:hypothetical protein